MADLDPEKVGRSGIDPITGSILSQDLRNTLLKKSIFDSSVFRNDLLAIEGRRREFEVQNTTVIQNQEQALIGFNSNIQSLRADIGRLGVGLSNISLLLQQDYNEEQSRIRAEQERQRILAERQVRIGKENDIEQRIQGALLEPVQKLSPKVFDIFGNIKNALTFLFAGWLTNQTVQALRASEENNTQKFNDIRFNILKNVGIIFGGLVAIRAGFSLVKRTIGSIAKGLTNLLIAKPLSAAASLIRLPGTPKSPPPRTAGPRGSGILNMLGKFATGVTAFMNAKNAEYVDSVIGALSLLGPGKLFSILRLAYAADEIAEAFGMNIFGKNPNAAKQAEEVKRQAEQEAKSTKQTTSTTTSTPKESMVPKPSPSKTTSEESTSSPPTTQAQPSAEMVKQFEMAWQYRNNPMARGRIEGAWEKMSPEQQQQAKDWAKTKGYDWSEMRLKDAPAVATMSSPMTSSDQSSPEKPKTAEVVPMQSQPQKVGQLPEPKPSLTMIKTSSNQTQQQNPPITNGTLSDVPLINSANPDNFYILYSQLNYNVVI
jgi:hypothetical protein